jgi:hypothetical protein
MPLVLEPFSEVSSSARWSSLFLLVATLLVGGIGCSKSEGPATSDWFPDRDFIFVSIDTLRADHLSSYGYARATDGDVTDPWSLAWLATQSSQYQTCWAPIGKTLPSLSSFWTGLFPLEHGAISNFSGLQKPTFASLFKDNGYQTHAVVANATLPGSGIDQGFDSFGLAWRDQEKTLGRQLLNKAEKAIASGEKLMLWAHWMSPHQPYSPAPEFATTYTERREPKADNNLLYSFHRDPNSLSAEDKQYCIDLYDAEILTATSRLQEFLKGLDQRYRDAGRGGLKENAVIVFFSDHGEELADRQGYFMHAKSLFSGVLKVPLYICAPGMPTGIVNEPISLQRVLPWLLSGENPKQNGFPGSWQTEYYSWRQGDWTLIHNPANSKAGPLEPPDDAQYSYPELALFNRSSDPLEFRDVSGANRAITEQMLGELHSWYSGLTLLEPKFLPGKDPKIRRQYLVDMGYLDSVPDTVVEPWGNIQQGSSKGSNH